MISEITDHTTVLKRLKADIQWIYDDKCDGQFLSLAPSMNIVWNKPASRERVGQ